MQIAGLICEYNPFHWGHLFQINEIKKTFSPYIVAIMSSNFTQRGEPSVISKFSRARIAVDMGVSLVLELPTIYSSSSAKNFSLGGISVLKSLGIIDKLYFGCENDYRFLEEINNKIINNFDKSKLESNIKKGHSYLKAMEMSFDFLNEEEKNVLNKPNNKLAIEYIRAIEKLRADFSFCGILRKKTYHNDLSYSGKFSSSSFIRKLLYDKKDISTFIPYGSNNFKDLHFLDDLYDLFKFKILTYRIDYDSYMDYEKGLENRIFNNLNACNVYDFINKVNSKRYTSSRIKRLMIEILLDIKRDIVKNALNVDYIRVLAMDDRGREILNLIKNEKIIKFKENYDKSSGVLKELMNIECKATNVYNLKNSIMNEDFTKSPYVKKN